MCQLRCPRSTRVPKILFPCACHFFPVIQATSHEKIKWDAAGSHTDDGSTFKTILVQYLASSRAPSYIAQKRSVDGTCQWTSNLQRASNPTTILVSVPVEPALAANRLLSERKKGKHGSFLGLGSPTLI